MQKPGCGTDWRHHGTDGDLKPDAVNDAIGISPARFAFIDRPTA
jgi:hypothetical protein